MPFTAYAFSILERIVVVETHFTLLDMLKRPYNELSVSSNGSWWLKL